MNNFGVVAPRQRIYKSVGSADICLSSGIYHLLSNIVAKTPQEIIPAGLSFNVEIGGCFVKHPYAEIIIDKS